MYLGNFVGDFMDDVETPHFMLPVALSLLLFFSGREHCIWIFDLDTHAISVWENNSFSFFVSRGRCGVVWLSLANAIAIAYWR